MEKKGLDISYHLKHRKLDQLVENRTAYTLEHAEITIYETHKSIYDVAFQTDIPLLASMISGKKIMHVNQEPSFEFVPGESIIIAPDQECLIDFPEASELSPTACMKLAIAPEKVASFCSHLNEQYPQIDVYDDWRYEPDGHKIVNDIMINQLLNRLLLISTENNAAKEYFSDLVLQELMVRLMQTQARNILLTGDHKNNRSTGRFEAVADHVRKNLHENITVSTLSKIAYMSEPHFFRCFKQRFGITPVEFINEQRIKAAKKMLKNTDLNVSEVGFACGFNNLNYFLKMFKRITGLTPARFRKSALI